METELIEKWKARIVAREVFLLPPAVQSGAQFLLGARNDREAWGAYARMPLDLVSSAAAIEALEFCEQSDFEPTVLNSRIALRDYIREHADVLDLSGLTASLRILAPLDRSTELCELVESIVGKIREARAHSGWGSPVTAIPSTADVLLALLPYREIAGDLIDSTVKFLHDEQNQDGGWPVAVGRPSAPVPSARAICALVVSQPEQESNDFQDASRYLQSVLTRGWELLLSESGGVNTIAQVLRAAGSLKSFPFDMISPGIDLLLDQRNSDAAWGERKGGNSNVEATSACLIALCAAGANRLISSKVALSAITDAGIALQEVRNELDQMRGDIRNQVTRGTGRIVAENDRLNARVIELEKEKKILVSRVEETEREVSQLLENVSDKLDIQRGHFQRSLIYAPGFTDIAVRFGQRILPLLVAAVAVPGLLEIWRLVVEKAGLPDRFITYAKYAAIGAFAMIFLGILFRLISAVRGDSSVFMPGMEIALGNMGASDRKVILRGLSAYVEKWSPSMRESFFHQLSRLPLDPDARELAARSIAREFAEGSESLEELRILLGLFASLPRSNQTAILYSLR
jgi:hypothetical protein